MKDLYWFMQGALAFSNLSHEQREAKLHSCAEHATNLARSINADESPERLEIIMQKLRGMNQSSTLKGPKEAFECEDCGKMEWLNWITCDIDGRRTCSSCVVRSKEKTGLFYCRTCSMEHSTSLNIRKD